MQAADPDLPTLFSFRRCPYAIRARLALYFAQQAVNLFEVQLRNKPAQLTNISAKATVPVLLQPNSDVIDESLAIAHWALQQNDPHQLLSTADQQNQINALIEHNDAKFKYWLDRYKYFERYPEHSQTYYRTQGERFLQKLEQRLQHGDYLLGNGATLADIAILPFVRQFAHVDREWFYTSQYSQLNQWLARWLASDEFTQIMQKPLAQKP